MHGDTILIEPGSETHTIGERQPHELYGIVHCRARGPGKAQPQGAQGESVCVFRVELEQPGSDEGVEIHRLCWNLLDDAIAGGWPRE